MLTSIAEAPVRFSAPCHSSPVYGAARAEAVPHAGMSPPVYRSGVSAYSALAWRLGVMRRVGRGKVSTAWNDISFPFHR